MSDQVEELLEGNRAYVARVRGREVPRVPARALAVVTCMDVRIEPYSLLGLKTGDAHVIRNAGGAVTEDVIRSLVVSQRLLGTRAVVLIQHTDCGMTTFTDEGLKRQIQEETSIRPPFSFEAFEDLDEEVRQSIQRVKNSPFLLHRDGVRGFVCEVHTGELREVQP